MKTLVLNCGSSSIKYQLIETTTEEALAKGQVERIGMSNTNCNFLHPKIVDAHPLQEHVLYKINK